MDKWLDPQGRQARPPARRASFVIAEAGSAGFERKRS